MTERIRIGVLGLTHDHVWSNLDELASLEGAELVAAADPHAALLDRVRERFACATYADGEELLQWESLDAVYVYSDNKTSVELAIAAASRGLHIMIEKPLAHSLDGATRILDAVKKNGIRLMVNWPFAWWPQLRQAIALAQSGKIGRIWQVKYRAAHAGPKEMGCSEFFCDWLYDPQRNGGGALIDYCCYGALLACVLLGKPESVNAITGRFGKTPLDAEDNAVLVMKYPQAMAIAEASWTQVGKLATYIPMIYGTEGTLMVEPRTGGRVILADEAHQDGTEISIEPAPPELASASAHFVHCIRSGANFTSLCNSAAALDAQQILEAGRLAAERQV